MVEYNDNSGESSPYRNTVVTDAVVIDDKKVSFVADSPRSVGVASTDAPATSAPTSPMADADFAKKVASTDAPATSAPKFPMAGADLDNMAMDTAEPPKRTPAAGVTLKHLRHASSPSHSAALERVGAKDVVVPGIAPSPRGFALAAQAKENESKSFREISADEKAIRSQGYAGALTEAKIIAHAQADKKRTPEVEVPEAPPALRSAGYHSNSRSCDRKRDSTLPGLQPVEPEKFSTATVTSVHAIQKGVLVQPLTKIQKGDLKRAHKAAQQSVVTTWTATPKVGAAGNKGGKGHHQDVKKELKLDAVPYEEVKNPKDLASRNMMRLSKHQINMEEFADTAAGHVKAPIFDKLNKAAAAVAPYQEDDDHQEGRAQVQNIVESVTADAAGNKGDRGHYMGLPVKRERVVPEDTTAAPLRRPPIEKKLQITKDGQFAGNVNSRGHFLVSDHAQMAKLSPVPYSDEKKADMRAGPRNFDGAAGNAGNKGHNKFLTRSKSMPAVPYDDSVEVRGRKQAGDATGAGNLANRGHHQMRIKSERACAIAPYETSGEVMRGRGKNANFNMHTFHAHTFEKQDHVKSTVRGANPIKGAVPYDEGRALRQRQNETTDRSQSRSAVPYQAGREVRGMRHFPQGPPKMPTTKTVEIVRNKRNGGEFRPINHTKTFVHQVHTPSKEYKHVTVEPRSRGSFENRSGRRNFSVAPVTGFAVPYENAPARRHQSLTANRSNQSNNMMDVLKPVAKCQVE